MTRILTKIIIFILLLSIQKSYAVDLAVMLFSSDQHEADKLYQEDLKDLGFKRLYGKYKSDYHVSIGYIDDVEERDQKELTQYVESSLKSHLSKRTIFEFGASSMLGNDIPYIVAIPKNTENFIELNKVLSDALTNYKHHKYKLKRYSLPGRYIPHLTLNAKVYREVPIDRLATILERINHRLKDKSLKLDRLVIN